MNQIVFQNWFNRTQLNEIYNKYKEANNLLQNMNNVNENNIPKPIKKFYNYLLKELSVVITHKNTKIKNICDGTEMSSDNKKDKMFFDNYYSYLTTKEFTNSSQIDGVGYNGFEYPNYLKEYVDKHLIKTKTYSQIIENEKKAKNIPFKFMNNSNKIISNDEIQIKLVNKYLCVNFYDIGAFLTSHFDPMKRFWNLSDISILNLEGGFSLVFGNGMKDTYFVPYMEEYVGKRSIYIMESNSFVRNSLKHCLLSSRTPQKRIAVIVRTLLKHLAKNTKNLKQKQLQKHYSRFCLQVSRS